MASLAPGKSTIAATILDDCDVDECVAAFIFFRRGMEEHNSIIRAIACQLTAFNNHVAENIVSSANRFRNIAGTASKRQFEQLLLTPLTLSSQFVAGPIHITSSNPFSHARITPHLLTDASDQKVAVQVTRKSREVYLSELFSSESIVADAYADLDLMEPTNNI